MNVGPIRSNLLPSSMHLPSSRLAGGEAIDVGHEVRTILFGRPKPPALDPNKLPPALLAQLTELLQKLKKYKNKLAQMAGDEDEEYSMYLAEGTLAAIDEQGEIAVGWQFLQAMAQQPEVLIGVIAHEIGHRPKRWRDYDLNANMSREQINNLARFEETRADMFAGRALAELGFSYQGLTRFLMNLDPHDEPHEAYHPATGRARIVKEAHLAQRSRAGLRKRDFPDMDRHTNMAGHIGTW